MVKQSGLSKSLRTDPNEHEGQHSSRRVREPQCRIDRLDDYNAGGFVDDAVTPFLEGTELHRMFVLEAKTCADDMSPVQIFKSRVKSIRPCLSPSQERRQAERLRSALDLIVSADLMCIE